MRLKGGRAFSYGVIFFTEGVRVKACLEDGNSIKIERKQEKAGKILKPLGRIPFIRGIAALFQANPFITTILLLLSLVPLPEELTLSGVEQAVEAVPDWVFYFLPVVAAVVAWFGFAGIFRFHGAEHKAANCFNKGKPLTLENVRLESRVAANCGTNLLVFLWPLYALLLLAFPVFSGLDLLLSISVAYELFKLPQKFFPPLYFVGGLLQKYLTTREPGDRELLVAIAALNGALEARAGI